MSAASPQTMPCGLWIMTKALAAMWIRSPAIAITDAIDAAIPSMYTSTWAGCLRWRLGLRGQRVVDRVALEDRAATGVDPHIDARRLDRLELPDEVIGTNAGPGPRIGADLVVDQDLRPIVGLGLDPIHEPGPRRPAVIHRRHGSSSRCRSRGRRRSGRRCGWWGPSGRAHSRAPQPRRSTAAGRPPATGRPRGRASPARGR